MIHFNGDGSATVSSGGQAQTFSGTQAERDAAVAAFIAAHPDAVPVPEVISMMQAELYLAAIGKKADLDAIVAAADAQTQIYVARAYEIHRDHPVTIAMGTALGFTSTDLDNMFIAAKAIT